MATKIIERIGKYEIRPRGRKGGVAVYDTEWEMWASTAGTLESCRDLANALHASDQRRAATA